MFNWTDIDTLPEDYFYAHLEPQVLGTPVVLLDFQQKFSEIPDGGLIIPMSLKEEPLKPVFFDDTPKKPILSRESRIITNNMNLLMRSSPLANVFNKYKTQLCRNQDCKRTNCAFAHSKDELRTIKQNIFEFKNSTHPLILK